MGQKSNILVGNRVGPIQYHSLDLIDPRPSSSDCEKEAVTHLADSSCEEGAGKVGSPVTEDTNTGWSTVARASRNTAQPLDRT